MMPGRNGTGPIRMGKMSGRRVGRMRNHREFCRYADKYYARPEDKNGEINEKDALKANAEYLEMKLKEINERIESLQQTDAGEDVL